MNVTVKPAVECPKFRAHQDEGLSYLGSLQQSVQIIHHPGEKQHSVVSAENQDSAKLGQVVYLFSLQSISLPVRNTNTTGHH